MFRSQANMKSKMPQSIPCENHQNASKRTKLELVENTSNILRCDFCDESFQTEAQKCLHIYEYHTMKNFKCDICDVQFKHEHVLQYHKQVMNHNLTIKCDTCDKVFKKQELLQFHIQMKTCESKSCHMEF